MRGIARLSKFGRQEAKFADNPLASKGQPIFTLPDYTCALLLFCTVNLRSKFDFKYSSPNLKRKCRPRSKSNFAANFTTQNNQILAAKTSQTSA
ncbi:hypothetical protein CAMSH0001_1399 [Campylobacter showae RM3277]|uniref:Uncharacterized protein n=1 Tax=Campylobacter showae RM3277 TaxID=553219 RepID=C6RIQ2_9BACT|nr:hypothetical protein CAMSH0001_1399 [Campylobacter showae RM3277]